MNTRIRRRQLVPRWRPWRVTTLLGEASPNSVRTTHASRNAGLAALIDDYESRSHHEGLGAELLSASVTRACRTDDILEMARSMSGNRRSAISELAESVLQSDEARGAAVVAVEPVNTRRRVAHLRRILRREPRNAVRWVDLGREYVAVGQLEKAEAAIRVARAIAPNDRFVLRSASVLYVQLGDLERAVAVLENSPATPFDPWLLAPLIAIADLGGAKVRGYREGMRTLKSGGFSPHQLAELASAVGSLEISAGADRKGRQLLRRSLESPTDNALAQAVWIWRDIPETPLDELSFSIPRAFEAEARQAATEGDWRQAADQAKLWMLDQPFSADAAGSASSWLFMIEAWAEAEEILDAGIQANPFDAGLLNNRAFARIESGELEAAVADLKKARTVEANRFERLILTATEGLALFRSGFTILGRERYQTVITAFSRLQNRDLTAEAALMLAREELLAGTGEADSYWKRAEALAAVCTGADIRSHRAAVAKIQQHQSSFGPSLIPAPEVQALATPLLEALILPREGTVEKILAS